MVGTLCQTLDNSSRDDHHGIYIMPSKNLKKKFVNPII